LLLAHPLVHLDVQVLGRRRQVIRTSSIIDLIIEIFLRSDTGVLFWIQIFHLLIDLHLGHCQLVGLDEAVQIIVMTESRCSQLLIVYVIVVDVIILTTLRVLIIIVILSIGGHHNLLSWLLVSHVSFLLVIYKCSNSNLYS